MRRPINAVAWERRMKRLRTLPKIAHGIPGIMAFEMETALMAYYGSRWKLAWHCLYDAFYFGITGFYWHHVYQFCDFMKWTHLKQIPGTPHKVRHGRFCDCKDEIGEPGRDCIDISIPQWFRKLTRMNSFD